MEVPFPELLALARRARRDGARVIWNFAPAPTSFRAADIRELIAASDVFVVNEHEARVAADLIGVPGDEEVCRGGACDGRGGAVVLTQGARGAFAIAADGAPSRAGVPEVRVVDTTGAGDTFVGVLAAAMAERRPISEALHSACRAASLSCEKIWSATWHAEQERPSDDAHRAGRLVGEGIENSGARQGPAPTKS